VPPIGLGFAHSNHRRVRCKQSTIARPPLRHGGTIFVAIELSQRTWLVTITVGPGSDFAHKARGAITPAAGFDRQGTGAGGPASWDRTCGGQLLRGGLRRLLAASAFDGAGFGTWCSTLPACGGATGSAGEDRSDRWRAHAAELMAYLRGEPRVVRIVRVPTVEQEDARRTAAERDRLIKEQTAHGNASRRCCGCRHGGGEPGRRTG